LFNQFGRAVVRALGCVELARLVPQLRLGRSQLGFPLVDSFHACFLVKSLSQINKVPTATTTTGNSGIPKINFPAKFVWEPLP
jgi:hypothetical protein